jgi:hypothetical protein
MVASTLMTKTDRQITARARVLRMDKTVKLVNKQIK